MQCTYLFVLCDDRIDLIFTTGIVVNERVIRCCSLYGIVERKIDNCSPGKMHGIVLHSSMASVVAAASAALSTLSDEVAAGASGAAAGAVACSAAEISPAPDASPSAAAPS